MQTERADLYFQQGTSDKVYHLQLDSVNDQWAVRTQWGRRGSALKSDVKADGVPYEKAKRVYNRTGASPRPIGPTPNAPLPAGTVPKKSFDELPITAAMIKPIPTTTPATPLQKHRYRCAQRFSYPRARPLPTSNVTRKTSSVSASLRTEASCN